MSVIKITLKDSKICCLIPFSCYISAIGYVIFPSPLRICIFLFSYCCPIYDQVLSCNDYAMNKRKVMFCS